MYSFCNGQRAKEVKAALKAPLYLSLERAVDGVSMLLVEAQQVAAILRERLKSLGDGRCASRHLRGPTNVRLRDAMGGKGGRPRWVVVVDCEIRTDVP